MPTYEVTSPDGRTFEVTAPDGATKDDVLAYAQQQFASLAEPAPPQKPKFKDYLKDIPKAVGRGGAGLLETSAIGASALLPDEYEEAARKGIAGIAKPVQEYLAPSSQEVGESISSKLAAGVGSTLPFFAMGPAGLAGRIGAGALGVSAGAGEARQGAEREGATAEERGKATLYGAPTGLLDILAPNIAPFKSLLVTAAARGGVEGLTEAAQKVAQNLIAKGVYKPEQEILVGAGEEGAYGAGVGALTSLIVDMTLGRRAKTRDTSAPQPERELTQAPERAPVETFTQPPVGFDAERAAGLRAQAEQAEQDRIASIEAGRLAEEAAAQQAVRGMPGFAGAPDINTELLGIARDDRAQEQRRLEAERRAQIKQIENTQFSTDPFQDQVLRNRALQQIAPAPEVETADAPEPKAVDPLAELTQEIPDLPTYKPKAPPKTVPMSEEDMEAVKTYKQDLATVEKQLTEAKKSSTDLFKLLSGKMSYQDVLEVAPEIGNKFKSRDADTAKKVTKYKQLINTKGKGRSLSSMVADGELNEYLPEDMRLGSPTFDEAESTQYIYDKMASGDTRSFDESQAMKTLEDQRATLQELINDPQRRADLNYQAQAAATEQRGMEPLPFGDLIADAQGRGVDTDAVMERVAMQMPPDATPAQYQGEVRNQIDNEIAAREGRPAAGAAPIMEELRQQSQGGGNSPTPEGTKIEKELTGKSFDQLVQWSVDNAPNRFNKLVAQKVQAMIRALKQQGVEMQFDLQGGKSRNIKMREAEGITTYLFSSEGTNVFLQLNGEPVFEKQIGYPSGMSYGTIQHELLHVATRSATRFLPADHPAIKDLNELYGQVVKQYNKDLKAGTLPPVLQKYYRRINNALETPDELITWGLTDREFQEYLANIKVGPKQTAFNKLVSLVRDLLGIAKPFETAMEKLVRTTDSILETDIEVIKGSMQKIGYAMGKAKPPTTQLKQQSLFSKRVQQLLQDDLMVRKGGFYFDAKESPLYQTRTAQQARVVSDQDFDAAVRGTKTGQRIMDKNIQIKDGDYVGVRLDLNILRSTGVPVQSIHQGKESTHEKGSGFFNGEVIKYAPWVTLKNVRFKIQQGARERIASGKETKSPMGSADGQYVATDTPNFDGIELRFNPNREHLFRDAMGRAVKYADEVTTTRNGIFARGNIEYFGEEDVPPVAISPSESRLMQEGEVAAKAAAQQTGSVPAPIQESLFKSNGVGSTAAPQRTQLGSDTMEMLEGIGRTVAEPEPGYIEKVRQSWDNARDNPQATREAAYGSFRRFADQVETWAFSSDAGLNNQIRREIMNSMVGQEQKIGMLLNTSLSQTAHSDAVSNLFIMEGNIRYDTDLHKWVGVKDENNIINLSKKLDEIADKLGLNKQEVELMAHTAFEARRTQELNRFNEQIERQAEAMKAQAAQDRAAGRAVAASALNEKANNLLKKKKITTNMTPEALQTGLRLYDMHPGLKEVTKIWNGIRQNALDRMVESGLYTAEEAEMLMSAADYVPFFREDQIEEGKGPKEFLRSLAVQADKRLKGSSKPVNDIFDNMVRWTQYAINRGVRNRSGLALATTAQQMGLADRVQDARDGENVVTVWEDGKKVYFSMQDPMFVSAFRGLESVSIPTVKFFSKFADVLRQSVVLYPLFSIAQVPQDSFAAMFTSGLKPQHALTIPVRAVKEFIQTLRGKSKAHEELKNVGAVGVRDFTSAIIRADAEIAAGLKEEKGLWAGVKRRLGNWAMAADNAVRQATYEAALAQGLSRAEAIEKAFEIFNVRRRGNSQMLAMAGQVIPFFNAYLAAQHVAYRTLTGVGTSPTERKAAFQTLAATTGAVMALSVLYAMMNGDDDDYLNKPTPTRDRLLMVPGTGGWVSIPLRADIFALPKVLAEHTYLLMTDNGYEDPAKFRASMASLLANSIFSPTPVPQAIKPLAESIMNYDFFQQKPLVGTFQQRKELKQQFEDSTSEFAKVLGSTNMVSPIVADHFIRGMFGSFGGLFLYMTNPILADMAGKPRPTMSYQDALATIPNASGFVSKEYEVALRKDFYALKEVTDRVGATISDMKTRSPQELADYLSDEDVRARYALTPAVNQIAQQLTNIRKAVNTISQAPEERMSDDEKQRQIQQLREAELRLLKGVNLKALRERANL